MGKSVTRFEVSDLFYLQNAMQKLKSDGGVTIQYQSLDWAEDVSAIEFHCDDGAITTKKRSRYNGEIFGFLIKVSASGA